MSEGKELLERVDQLIRLKATGSPKKFAEKLEVSERKIYRIIQTLKDIGCPVVYDSYIGSYKYEIDGSLKIKFFPKNAESIDLKNVKGGFSQNILYADKIRQWQVFDLTSDNTENA